MYNMSILLFGYKMNGTTIILGVVFILFLCHIFCNCRNQYLIENLENLNNKTPNKQEDVKPKKEGFTGLSQNIDMYSTYSINAGSTDSSSWNQNQKVKKREDQPVPLPPGEMSLFLNTKFKPECCPNMYTNSSGCACMTTKQYNWLALRGGNNVPYSKF